MPFGNTKGSDKTLSNENAISLRYKLKSRGLKWACVLLSAVACFVASCVVCSFIGVYGWKVESARVVIVDNLFSVIHAAVADLDGIAIEDFP